MSDRPASELATRVGDDAPELVVTRHDGVLMLVLHRPHRRNALSSKLLTGLRAALREADVDERVDVVVLTGSDPAFCAGLDLDELASADGGLVDGGVSTDFRGPLPVITKPLIGAVNGDAITGGLELALACDLLVASSQARFADTHARFGMVPAWGMIARLPQRIGASRAMELSLSGRFLPAEEALAWGLVNRVVPHEELMGATLDLAARIAANDRGAVRAILGAYAQVEASATADAWGIEAATASTQRTAGIDPTVVAARKGDVMQQARGAS